MIHLNHPHTKRTLIGMVRHTMWLAMLLMAALGLGGCLDVDLKGGRTDDRVISGPTNWPFAPTSMRVSPFTSIGYDEDRKAYRLDLMVELRDRVGDLTKGVGEFNVELRQLAGGTEGQLLYAWNASIATVEQNVQHFNPALSAYNFKLALDAPLKAGERTKVIVRFTDSGGSRLLAEGEVTVDAATATNE
jgi:hypothetical protein